MQQDLLSSVIEATPPGGRPPGGATSRIERFLAAPSETAALAVWIEDGAGAPPGPRALRRRLLREIAAIDGLLSEQLDAILHHPTFQRLEARWRGLAGLVQRIDPEENVELRVLDLSWRELARDLERAIEFDQSQLFRKVYNEEFGTPGGKPYGVLLGDYELAHRPRADQPTDDVSALRALSQVAAAAFAPFVAAAHPSLLGLDSFTELERPIALARSFEGLEHLGWRSLRAAEEARFVGLVLPRALMRRPWGDEPLRADGFRYREDVSAPDRSGYLWGTAIWAFGEVLLRAFQESGWLGGIRGARRGLRGGGIVEHLCNEPLETDAPGLLVKGALDVVLTDEQEKELCDLGLVPLLRCQGTSLGAFYGNASIQSARPEGVGPAAAAAAVNHKLSSMLQYVLCVSRFAHYLKVIGREKVGSFRTADDIERVLNDWLVRYATANEGAPLEVQAKYPLREARVEVRELAGRPGSFGCTIHLRPHYQLDQMTSTVRLVTELFTAPER